MDVQSRWYSFNNYKSFPRPHFFLRRLNGFWPRFEKVVGAFPESFHDERLRSHLHTCAKVFDRPLSIVVISNTDIDLRELVVKVEEDVPKQSVPKTADLFTEDKGHCIFVCYIKVEDFDNKGEEAVQTVIKYFNSNIRDSAHDVEVFMSLFICCEVKESRGRDIKLFIQKCLGNTPDNWSADKCFVTDHSELPIASEISKHLEDLVLDCLLQVYDYLKRFVRKQKSVEKIGDLAHVDEVEKALKCFVNGISHLKDIKQLHMDIETEELKEKVVDDLAKQLKCAIADPLAKKLGMPVWVCNTCLEELHAINVIKEKFSKVTKMYIGKLIEDNEEQKRHNDFMVQGMQNDVSAACHDIEERFNLAMRQIIVIEKMLFEIEGYFKVAGKSLGEQPTPVPPEAVKELFRLKEVIGVGTIYGTLQVHVQESEQKTKNKIAKVLSKHKFYRYYEVKKIEQESQPLANIQHENGTTIMSLGLDKMRQGTLGAFSELSESSDEGSKHLYALTCAHVVSPLTLLEQDVFVMGRGGMLQKLGVSTPQLTIETGRIEDARLVDLAAVKVVAELQRHCKTEMKDEECVPRRSHVTNMSLAELEKQTVFKFGAKTYLTRGLVCSVDYQMKVSGMMSADYLLVIEKQPGSDKDFAQAGDSGSVVCMTHADLPRSVAKVSMIFSGEMKLDGNDTNLCLSFLLRKGLEALSQKSGINLLS